MGLKHGSIDPKTLPKGLRDAAQSMAKMSEESLADFMHTTKRKPKTLLH
jgi:hypothetical protein